MKGLGLWGSQKEIFKYKYSHQVLFSPAFQMHVPFQRIRRSKCSLLWAHLLRNFASLNVYFRWKCIRIHMSCFHYMYCITGTYHFLWNAFCFMFLPFSSCSWFRITPSHHFFKTWYCLNQARSIKKVITNLPKTDIIL